jgi:thiol:disulfide interchange protein
MKGMFMTKTVLCISFLVVVVSPLVAKQPVDSLKTVTVEHVQKFDPTHDVNKDIQDAIRLAQNKHKRILLDVGGEWCIWCHRLDSLFLRNADLMKYLQIHYVVVKVNVSKENRNEEFLSRYPKVAGYPHLFVLESNGTLLHSQNTEDLEFPKEYPVKGHDKKKVFAFLKKWARKQGT